MAHMEELIGRLVAYGHARGMVATEDMRYTVNLLLDLFHIDSPDADPMTFSDVAVADAELEVILDGMLDYAAENGLLPDNTVTYRDLFDTRIMNCLMPRPSEVVRNFRAAYARDPREATDYYYRLACDSNYIRRYRVARDMKWTTNTPYGILDITINLSKPEKDPRAIAAAKLQKSSSYPRCLLCSENEGYAGRVNHPARENHRLIPLTLDGGDWFLQYSPYVYYNEHCILLSASHTPMTICPDTFRRLTEFVTVFPHYMVGSNADLPIVGGSILAHEHYQGGNYRFAMMRAPLTRTFTVAGFYNVKCGVVKWPMTCLRLEGTGREAIVELASHILAKWRDYTDEDAFIFAETDGERHNTITPIAYRDGENYVLDLVLRNNITTEERPLGVYHPREELHHIKKENIGLIEVMGLAILPARLKNEMQAVKNAILAGTSLTDDPLTAPHAAWAEEFLSRRPVNAHNIVDVLHEEIGAVFAAVLADAGVYKDTPEGQAALDRFLATL